MGLLTQGETMSDTNTGGPAFPLQDASTHQFHGISIRDYFAAKAMQALINGIEPGKEHQTVIIPSVAYQMADAMIKARDAK
jgi:hypothetical protein